MTSSIQTVGTKSQAIYDMDLLLFVGMLVKAWNADNYSSLGPIVEIWNDCLNSHGPGTIDIQLDKVASNTSSRMEILRLVDTVENQLCEFETYIPSDVIRKRWNVKGVRYFDYDIQRVHRVADKFRSLLSGADKN